MNSASIKKRMEAIEKEHDSIVDKCGDLQDELNRLVNRRVQLEGAFNELVQMYDEEVKTENSEAELKPKIS